MQHAGRGDTIPTFLSIDVEPEGFQLDAHGRMSWEGFPATLALVASLRDEFARLHGRAPHFGWYFRTDPQIANACGRPDAVVHHFADPIARLQAHGDYFGVHMHPLRWSAPHSRWVHDVVDCEWLRRCTHASLDAFEQWSGAPARLFRGGAGFMHEVIVETLDERGVALELSLEPVRSWGLDSSVVPNGIDDSPIVGSFIDCASAPATPYHPARGDFRRRGGAANARRILLVPHSTGPYSIPRAGWWPRVRRSVRRGLGKRPARHMYYLTSPWPSPRYFWDVVEHAVSTMARPYLSLGMRTDRYGSMQDTRVRAMLKELLVHPLAARLRFVNPLDAVGALVDHRVPAPIARQRAPGSVAAVSATPVLAVLAPPVDSLPAAGDNRVSWPKPITTPSPPWL